MYIGVIDDTRIRQLLERPDWHTYGLFDERDQLVAARVLRDRSEVLRDRPEMSAWLLTSLVVAPDCRNRGYGRLMLGGLEECARGFGATALELTALGKSGPFYSKLGYSPHNGRVYRKNF